MAASANNLQTQNNYGWLQVLNAQVTGGKVPNLNAAQDVALVTHREAFVSSASTMSSVSSIISLLAVFNQNLTIPDLSLLDTLQLSSPPVGLNSNVTLTYNFTPSTSPATANKATRILMRGSTLPQNQVLWKLILSMFQVWKGRNYVPTDIEFMYVFYTVFKGPNSLYANRNVAVTPRDVFNEVLAYIRSQPGSNIVSDRRLCVMTLRLVPPASASDMEFQTQNQVFNLANLTNQTPFGVYIHRYTQYNANTQPVSRQYLMRLVLDPYDQYSDVIIEGMPAPASSSPFQYIINAALSARPTGSAAMCTDSTTGEVGGVVTLTATSLSATTASGPSTTAPVSFIHAAYDPATTVNLNMSFEIKSIDNAALLNDRLYLDLIVDDYRTSPGTPSLSSIPTPLADTTPTPLATVDDIVLACTNPSLGVKFTMPLLNVLRG